MARVKLFHKFYYYAGDYDFLEEDINNWLDENPDVEIKSILTSEAATATVPHITIMVLYDGMTEDEILFEEFEEEGFDDGLEEED
jgi:hypothetical protein